MGKTAKILALLMVMALLLTPGCSSTAGGEKPSPRQTARAKESSASASYTKPEAIGPANGEVLKEARPVFIWEDVQGAKEYQFQLWMEGKNSAKKLADSRVKESQFTPRRALAGGRKYFWRVRALVGKRWGVWSEKAHFSLEKTPGLTPIPGRTRPPSPSTPTGKGTPKASPSPSAR